MQITEEVYAFDSTRGNYAYLIKGEETILIDTGRPGQGKGILNDLKTIGVKPDKIKHILITHHDVDHVGSLAFMQKETGAKIWASAGDIPYIYQDINRPGIKRLISFIMRVEKPSKINTYPEDGKLGVDGVQVIPTPGHTPGHVCLLYKDVLLAGDLFRTSHGEIAPMKSFMNWDDEVLRSSLEVIQDCEFSWVCPAHGEPLKVDGKLNLDNLLK